MDFGVEDGDGRGAGISGIVELVSSSGHTDTVCFFFLETDVADEVGIGYFATGWDILLSDGKNCTSSFDAFICWSIFADAVFEEASKFICITSIPSFSIRAFEQSFQRGLFFSRRCEGLCRQGAI